MVKLRNTIFIGGFLTIIFVMFFLYLVAPPKKTSSIEYRTLAQMPTVSKHKIISGEYFKEFDKYINDQVFGRNTFVNTYNKINLYILGKKKVNDIVIGKDNFLLAYSNYSNFNTKDAEIVKKNISQMVGNLSELTKYINNYGGQFYFVGVPHQISYNEDKYPKYFNNNAAENEFVNKTMFDELKEKGINYVDAGNVFRNSGESNIYFKTDHHYNFIGAYLVYHAIMDEVSKQNSIQVSKTLNYDDFNVVTLNNPFSGSRGRQLYRLFDNVDKLQVGYPKNKINYEKYDNGKLDNTLYYVPNNDKDEVSYDVYMGPDKAETIIKTHRNDLDNILVFGDSYTNPVEPLLAQNFGETRSLDLRHYNKQSLYDYIKEYKPKAVVLIRDDQNYFSQVGNGNFKGINK